MLTGDKLETAYNIGFSCKMFNEGMQPFTMSRENCPSLQKADEKLTQISEKMIIARDKVKKSRIVGS